MKQEQISAPAIQEEEQDDLGLRFKKEQANKSTRKVVLIYKSCCGCGCEDIKVQRTVPFTSSLQDGDRITELKDEDTIL